MELDRPSSGVSHIAEILTFGCCSLLHPSNGSNRCWVVQASREICKLSKPPFLLTSMTWQRILVVHNSLNGYEKYSQVCWSNQCKRLIADLPWSASYNTLPLLWPSSFIIPLLRLILVFDDSLFQTWPIMASFTSTTLTVGTDRVFDGILPNLMSSPWSSLSRILIFYLHH